MTNLVFTQTFGEGLVSVDSSVFPRDLVVLRTTHLFENQVSSRYKSKIIICVH